MPELPEVEVVRRGLAAALTGRTITAVDVIGAHGRRALRRHLPGPADFRAAATGQIITAVRRRGKYLWWALDNDDAIVAHLGMSGQFRVDTGAGPAHPHARLAFHLDDDSAVTFQDQRTFGGMMLVPGGAALPEPISHIARDPLDPDADGAAMIRAIHGKRSAIKRVLLDQSVVSGIGNIYADEALWAAKIHYNRSASTLAQTRIGQLLDSARDVMNAALAVGGTSFDALYVNVNGQSGYFERSLNVYAREGEPCPRCGAAIRREPFMNRSSFLCPRCQRPARTARNL